MANAIFPASRANLRADHLSISRVRRYDNRAYYSDRVYNEAKGSGAIFNVSQAGIVMANGRIFDAPCVRVRNTRREPFILVISEAEGRALSEHFGLKRKIWDGAYFEAPEGQRAILPMLELKPIWSELLTPRYSAAFRLWLAGKGPMPLPNIIPWRTRPGGFLSMPTIGPVRQIKEAERQMLIGKLILEQNNGSRYGIFRFNGENKRYVLRPDDFELVSNLVAKIDLDKFRFRELFLPWTRANREFTCSQRVVNDNMVYLGSLEGESFYLKFRKMAEVQRGKIYYFRFKREKEQLKVEAFNDAARQHLIGRRTIELNPEGFPYTTNLQFTLEMPEN